jgi:hypothetical protein
MYPVAAVMPLIADMDARRRLNRGKVRKAAAYAPIRATNDAACEAHAAPLVR